MLAYKQPSDPLLGGGKSRLPMKRRLRLKVRPL